MISAAIVNPFGAGPFSLEVDGDISACRDDERMIVVFSDFEAIFTVIGRARGAVHFGMYLTPWVYIHWRAEQRNGRWMLATTDRKEIARLARFYRVRAG